MDDPKSPALKPGLYEALISESLRRDIADVERAGWWVSEVGADDALLPSLLARHVHDATKRSLESVPGEGDERRLAQVRLANELISVLHERASRGAVEARDAVTRAGDLLREVRRPSPVPGPAEPARRPRISLSESSLLVNGHRDYQIGGEVAREVESADRIDLLSAFIRFAGLRLVRRELEAFTRRGGRLRVIASVYTGTTEKRALDELVAIGAHVKVSYETAATRLHAKAWLFQRDSGFHTAFIGSSNLTHSALVEGLEWNVRLSQVDNPGILDRVAATFEQYWNSPEFVDYDPSVDGDRLERALRPPTTEEPGDVLDWIVSLDLDLKPLPHQVQMLDSLETEREHGHRRNLVVAATGTGKTWVSAFDFRRLRAAGYERLLFVAHRDEILRQSQRVYQLVLKDPAFGERFIGSERPRRTEHVFASIQSLHRHIRDVDPEAWDVVIIDEAHHMPASSYQDVIRRLKPKILLGLTATPERTDGRSLLPDFDGRIAAEVRLWQALEQGLLSPFHYFGVNDGTDLSTVSYSRGRYGVSELEALYTGDSLRTQRILASVQREIPDPRTMRALGFCAGVGHAMLMSRAFNEAGINAVAVHGESSSDERRSALARLRGGRLQAIFTVDLFNEGIDVPEVDTLLLLRPTESATIFLQQLGRGLRWADGKAVLTVLDFIGLAHKAYRFDIRYRALIGGTRRQVASAVEEGFPLLPPGCAIRLDPIAQRTVLDNIKANLRGARARLVEDLRSLNPDTTLRTFLTETETDLDETYANPSSGHCFTELRRRAGHLEVARTDRPELERAVGRILHVDDPERIEQWRKWLSEERPPAVPAAATRSHRLMMMLFAALGQRGRPVSELPVFLEELWAAAGIRRELDELLGELGDRTRQRTVAIAPGLVPLHSHATYGLYEIVAAYGLVLKDRLSETREGVRWIEGAATDLLFITLKKSDAEYSPTTRYNDYPISPTLFHWESQSTTSPESRTGLRYQQHHERGSDVLLFVRNARKDERGETSPYRCLGKATYVSHESSRPMQVIWRLHRSMPAELYQEAKLAAG